MPASNYTEENVLQATLAGKTMPTAPVKVYLALTENAPTKTMTGTELGESAHGAELTYEGYARVEIKGEAAQWEVTAGSGESTASKIVNKNAITLKLNTNTTGKSLAKYFAVCDAVTAGNVLYFGKLTEELNIVKAITKLEIEAKKLEVTAE